MANSYPSIGEYNHVIQKKGGSAFRVLSDIILTPSKVAPIKIYLFGSGAFAAVFKGLLNDRSYAIRCFLSASGDTIQRYFEISNYLKQINSTWKVDCELINDEISVNGNSYPVLKMEWVNGLLINQFVYNYLNDNSVLSELQLKLIQLSEDLEKNKIGHGDLQCGNIIIVGNAQNFEIKLIDYDGMFVPSLHQKTSIEKGRSEFQHPKRTKFDFNSEMDRFSFWVIVTALEALKFDKNLWNQEMQGGFNTLDNFLFTSKDFIDPFHSKLFTKLYSLNSKRLNFYLDKLKYFCNSNYADITRPTLLNESHSQAKRKEMEVSSLNRLRASLPDAKSNFTIVSNVYNVAVLSTSLKKIGITPLELDKTTFTGKKILVTNGFETRSIELKSDQDTIEIKF